MHTNDNEALKELIETEETYNRRLNILLGIKKTAKEWLSGAEVELIFGNLDDIAQTNRAFLDVLHTDAFGPARVAEHLTSFEACYAQYCCTHQQASLYVKERQQDDPNFRQFMDAIGKDCLFDLGSLLLEPVQRIARYPLLLRQIVGCDHDSPYKEALQTAQQVLDRVNGAIGQHENEERLRELDVMLSWPSQLKVNLAELTTQGTRRQLLVHDIPCLDMDTARLVQGHIFNDLFLLTEVDEETGRYRAVGGSPWPIEDVEFDGSAIIYGPRRATLIDPSDQMLCVSIRESVDRCQAAVAAREKSNESWNEEGEKYCGSLRLTIHGITTEMCRSRNQPQCVRVSVIGVGTGGGGGGGGPYQVSTVPISDGEMVFELLCASPADSVRIEVIERRPFAMPISLGSCSVCMGEYADYFEGHAIRHENVKLGTTACNASVSFSVLYSSLLQ